jgi:phosphoribosylformimino-5-aminoimidazole carboxamide ribotide isomerase
MIILPAIDIKDGNCVRLIKGDFGTAHKVAENPFETAAKFKAAGAKWMHVVDLDGAKTGKRPNCGLIKEIIANSNLNVEIGGGIRDMDCIRDYIEGGAARVILGSAALENKELVKEAVKVYGEKIAVGIDARDGKVATRGWLETSDITYINFAKEIEKIGVKYIIFTDISCDGTLNGPNFKQLGEIQKAVSCNIIASGGIRDIQHIKKLCAMEMYGAICGKSIYSGTLDLAEAIKAGGIQQ